MISSKAFKKLAALTAAVALVGSFAVSASAAEVRTTTAYYGDNEIAVNVKVLEAGANAEVTYYATNDAGVFYIDQAKADGAGTATFTQYVTDADNLEVADVIVGLADTTTKAATVEGNKITINDREVEILPTAETTYNTTVTYAPGTNMTVDTDNVDVTGAEVSVAQGNSATEWIVSLSNITGDVTVDFNEKTTVVDPETVVTNVASGFIAADGNYKITVIGKVVDLISGKKCGITVDGTKYEAKYRAAESGARADYFVVQLLDETPDDNDFITLGEKVINVYAETNNGEVTGVASSVTVQ